MKTDCSYRTETEAAVDRNRLVK